MRGLFQSVKYGWAHLELGNFSGEASYLTNPMEDLGEVLLAGEGVVCCDEEGSSFEIVVTDYHVYIVSHRETHELAMTDLTREDLARMFVEEVSERMEEWAAWWVDKEAHAVPEDENGEVEPNLQKNRERLLCLQRRVAEKYDVKMNKESHAVP